MELSAKSTYTLEFTSDELRVVSALVHDFPLRPEDAPVLAHIRARFSPSLAKALQDERQRFFDFAAKPDPR